MTKPPDYRLRVCAASELAEVAKIALDEKTPDFIAFAQALLIRAWRIMHLEADPLLDTPKRLADACVVGKILADRADQYEDWLSKSSSIMNMVRNGRSSPNRKV
jgi:hypothetical protein